ncbi:MAG: GGDEF domain-containing response regulator [Legionellaceae bacterium]|nr:GGDEF domain-containing response regulator [Legionellaceae bacterium]
MKKNINILYLEDDPLDFDLIKGNLEEACDYPVEIQHATNQETYEAQLKQETFDIILSDYNLQSYTGLEALQYLNKKQYQTPFILLSGAIGDELAVEVMKAGAFDYVLKDSLGKLPMIIERALEAVAQKREKLHWESMFHTVEKAALAGFFRLNLHGNLIYSNHYLLEMLSCTHKSLLNQPWYTTLYAVDAPDIAKTWKKSIDANGSYERLEQYTVSDGTKKWINLTILPEIQHETLVGYIGIAFDVTGIKETEQKLEVAETYDSVTSLLNKKAFERLLKEHLEKPQGAEYHAMLLLSNIDKFQHFNDALGYKGGDLILKKMAAMLVTYYGKKAVVAKFSNDSFTVLLDGIERASDVIHLLDTLRDNLSSHPIVIKNESIHLNFTTGIAKIPDAGKTAQEILQHADQALQQAKQNARGSYCFYSADISARVARAADVEHALQDGLAQRELYLAYQPQIDIQKNQVIGLEALCRWNSQDLGEVTPGELIPLAEETGFILPITKYLSQQFFYDLAGLSLKHADLMKNVRVSFNLSAKVLTDKDFLNFLIDEFNRYDINPSAICFEVTETAIMENQSDAKLFLNKLSDMGFGLSIDDFGTGHSSLAYLKSLPVKELKIDGSFIKQIAHSERDRHIVETIIKLAHTLKLHVIAECVEDIKQKHILRKLNCTAVQGFYYSKPLKPEDLILFLRAFPGSKERT